MSDKPTVSGAILAAAVLALPAVAPAQAADRLEPAAPAVLVSPPAHHVTEFDVARDPADARRLAVGAIDLDKAATNVGCIATVSDDGGRTWRQSNPLEGLPTGDRGLSADPMVAFDRRGRLHLICLLPGSPSPDGHSTLRIVHVRSDDLGGSWTAPRDVPTVDPGASPDKPALHVAPDGRIVVCALQDVDGRPTIGVAVSDDDAATWRAFEPPSLAGFGGTCLGLEGDDDGGLHMRFLSLGGEKAPPGTEGVVSSADGGLTWREPVAISRVERLEAQTTDGAGVTEENPIFPLAGSVEVHDQSRTVYFASSVPAADRRHWTMALARSDDGGRSYRAIAPPHVPSAACAQNVMSPVLHADDRGVLALQFLCYDELQQGRGTREVWMTASTDRGESWLAPLALVREPSPRCAAPFVTSLINQADTCWRYYGGADYWFTESGPDVLRAFWVDHVDGYMAIRTQPFSLVSDPKADLRACVSRRVLTLSVPRGIRGRRVIGARVRFRGRRIEVLRRGDRLRIRVDLRGLPRGSYSVVMTLRTVGGARRVLRRRIRTCVPRSRSASAQRGPGWAFTPVSLT